MELHTWLAFCAVMTAIAYCPGPMTLFAMSSSVRYGLKRTLPGVVGGSAAYAVQCGVVYVGLGAIVANSAALFAAIKWFGVAYLFWLGVKQWRAGSIRLDAPGHVPAVTARTQFVRGFLTGMSNPKSILVFTALFPQFIDPAGPYTSQFFALYAAFFALQGSSALVYALFGARLYAWLIRRDLARVQGKVTGGVLFTAGGLLALSD